MGKQKFNLVIDLSWRSENNSICAICESFEISFYRLSNNVHNVQIKKETEKLCDFLRGNNISFTK